jgi:HlyD family secretion protein
MIFWIKRFGLALLVLAIITGFYLALREQPIQVDIAEVKVGPMRVTINEEGVARVRDIYTVSSPISGHLDRTKLDEGEAVVANQTIIASIHPLDPPFLDERTEAELKAAVEAANAAYALSKVERTQAQTVFEQAMSEYRRASELSKTNVISESKLERVFNDMRLQKAQIESKEAIILLRQAEVVSAQVRLRQPSDIASAPQNEGCCIQLVSPVDGIVLKVLARSEQAVIQGAPITEIGDPQNIEIEVDLLSSAAPKLKIGTKVLIREWGGNYLL